MGGRAVGTKMSKMSDEAIYSEVISNTDATAMLVALKVHIPLNQQKRDKF